MSILGYTPLSSPVTLTTDRMVLRQADQRDAWRIADYYAQNQEFLRPWEPRRDHSYFQHGGWQARLHLMVAQQRQGSACYFLLMDPQAQGVWGVANFTQIVKGCFYACYLGYSLAEKQQGQGLMYEGLQSAIRYIQRRHKMHRIMANYLPRNHRSGNLLARLGFEKERYAKDYLLINGRWEDHILTALIRREAELSSGL